MQTQVIIVGAGPAGVGCALSLKRAGIGEVVLLEAKSVGASFRQWPEEMRLITPSFHGNPFFQTDLNAVSPDTSPADFYQREHLSGPEYAHYLQALVHHFGLEVAENESVFQIEPRGSGYAVHTNAAIRPCRTVIWAAGEFGLPKLGNFPGAELCGHSSTYSTWKDFRGDRAVIIGGYESGIDAACHLVHLGKKVLVLSSGEPWKVDHPDPSEVLSPHTKERLADTLRTYPGRLALHGKNRVARVYTSDENYVIETTTGNRYYSEYRPVAATGFQSALTPIQHLFAWENSVPQFTEDDESTLYPGLFYSGPSLIQRGSKFCFIYKFRARFGVIVQAVARRLDYPEPDLEDDRRRGFLIDDLECCTNCECAIGSDSEPAGAH